MDQEHQHTSGHRYLSIIDGIIIFFVGAVSFYLISHYNTLDYFFSHFDANVSSYSESIISGFVIFALCFGLFGIRRWLNTQKILVASEKSERSLRLSKKRFQSIVNSLGDIVFTLDKRQRYTALHGRWVEKNNQFPSGSPIGKTSRELFGVKEGSFIEKSISRALAGETVSFEWSIKNNGQMHYFHMTVSPLGDESNNIAGVAGIGQDITETKKIEQIQNRYKLELNRMLEKIPEIIARYDKEGRYIYVNRSFETVTGSNRNQLIGKKESEISIAKELTPFWQHALHKVFKSGKEKTLVGELPTPTGIKYYQARLIPEKNRNGIVENVLVSVHDITTHKRQEEILRRSEKELERIFQSTPGGVTIVDLNGRIYYANKEAEQILGLKRMHSKEQYYNDPAYKISKVNGEPFPEKELPYIQVMMTGMPVYGLEHVIAHPDGRKVYLSVNAAPLLDYNNQITAIITAITDITKLKQAERERERLISELQAALNKVETLSGLLPICAFCKDIRDDSGYWHQVEAYIKEHSKANFSHGVCPDCAKKHYPEYFKEENHTN